ncbi:cytochrome [Mycobacteroides abscessus]|nr:cytochrome [Mycobacteroides abscessus]PVA39553.1 cytochrome [Mycobacteroides abscessus]PVA46482.1 cytochrome [Mycobacteroides abscessus]PVA61127.1 cytochrome [Mycobacteroides abscessus]PVA72790.1 cytochrome [Mycobacteroides abscessus]
MCRPSPVNSFDRSICSETHRFDPSPFDGTMARNKSDARPAPLSPDVNCG